MHEIDEGLDSIYRNNATKQKGDVGYYKLVMIL